LLVGVDEDRRLEKFWAEHRVSDVCESLGTLDLLGVTAPNFSHFKDMSRFQILRNRKRILLSAERFSKAGVRVSPHLNAITAGDWEFWLGFLREHPEVTTVTMEFQTGARADEDFGRQAFECLLAMRQKLGREIHPLLVGAGRFFKSARGSFDSFSIIDSQPFMQAVSRQVLGLDSSGRLVWKSAPTAQRAPLDDLIETNLVHYPDKLGAGAEETTERPREDPNQLELFCATSTPYFTAQPSAAGISEMNSAATVRCHSSKVSHSPAV
jgi:hypothetical protein